MRLCLVVLVCSFLFACSGNVKYKSFTGPNGKAGYSMFFPGTKKKARCYDTVNQLCANGYNILTNSQDGYISFECK